MNSFLEYIGHGRALEFFLGLFKLALAISITLSDLDKRIPPLADFAWFYPSLIIAFPFYILAFLHFSGIAANMIGYSWSWFPRFMGAAIAMFVWTFLLIKSSWIGDSTLIVPMAIACLPASAFLIYKSWHGLPIPGRAGMV